jgi:hypothetical protein
MALGRSQASVLAYLRGHWPDFITPTQIGECVGGKTLAGAKRHSSWASPICLSLVKKGLADRSPVGSYRYKPQSMGEFKELKAR